MEVLQVSVSLNITHKAGKCLWWISVQAQNIYMCTFESFLLPLACPLSSLHLLFRLCHSLTLTHGLWNLVCRQGTHLNEATINFRPTTLCTKGTCRADSYTTPLPFTVWFGE